MTEGIILHEGDDFFFEDGLWRDAHVALAHPAVLADDKRRRNAPNRAVCVLHFLFALAEQDGVVDLELGRKRLGLLRRVVHRVADDDQRVLVLRLQLDEARDLGLARAAPGGPEVKQHDLALERRQADVLAAQIFHRKVHIGRLGVGHARAARVGVSRPGVVQGDRHDIGRGTQNWSEAYWH